MKRYLAVVWLVLGGAWNAYAISPMTLHVSPTAQVVEVRLPANPTTGFQWTVLGVKPAVLSLKSQQYLLPNNRLMGAGGVSLFTFTVLQEKSRPKQCVIVLEYARSWDKSSATQTRVTVKFDH